MIYMYREFNDNVSVRFLVFMKSVIISFIKGYRGPTLRPACDVIEDVITMKTIFGPNSGRSFQIWGQNKAMFNISKLSKWPPFWGRDKLFTGITTGNWIYRQDSHGHFWYFELLIDVLAEILTELYQFQYLTYFVTRLRHRLRHECIKHNLHN